MYSKWPLYRQELVFKWRERGTRHQRGKWTDLASQQVFNKTPSMKLSHWVIPSWTREHVAQTKYSLQLQFV